MPSIHNCWRTLIRANKRPPWLIWTIFRQALDLLENPTRAPGWSYQDPDILQSQGQVSRLIVRGIDAMAAQRPELSATLRRFSTPAPASLGWQLRPHVPGRYSGWSGLTLGNLL